MDTEFVGKSLNVSGCARCGRDHHGLVIASFHRPIKVNGDTWKYWTTCPDLDEPILVNIVVNPQSSVG